MLLVSVLVYLCLCAVWVYVMFGSVNLFMLCVSVWSLFFVSL